MRDPYSLEAEHGVLGAMMQRPELIDVLADELTPESFYFADNAEVFRAIMAVRSANKAVDFLTVAEQLGALPSETPALAYCCEIVKNTPSIASASTYARIVRERAVDRALHIAAQDISEIASSSQEPLKRSLLLMPQSWQWMLAKLALTFRRLQMSWQPRLRSGSSATTAIGADKP